MKTNMRIAMLLILISASISLVAQDNRFVMWNANGISETVSVPYEKDQTGDVITNVISVGDAAAVDLSSIAGIMKTTTIGEWIVRKLTYTFEPSTNPNCLYLVDENTEISAEMAKSLEGLNVVKGTNAADVVLTSGFPFFTPRDFTANNIRYERPFDKGTQRGVGGGWQTIVLPFDVQTVTADGQNLKWFADANDDADFWVFKFVGGNDNTALFDYNSDSKLSAATPYIVAVPDQSWAGSEFSLEGKTLAFCGENVAVSNTAPEAIGSGNLSFIGTYTGAAELVNAYVMNGAGSSFAPNSIVEPFNAYVHSKNGKPAGVHIYIDFGVGTETGIGTVYSEAARRDQMVYDLQGRRISTLSKGVYVVDGKKVVVR